MDPAGSYARAAKTRRPSRLRVRALASALLLWGLVAAALALSVMLTPTGSLFLLGRPCAPPPADAFAERLRAEAALLLLSGAGQALVAQVALLVPWRLVASLALLVATRTSIHAAAVLLRIADYCPGPLQGTLAAYFDSFLVIKVAAVIAGSVVILFGE